MVGCVDESNKVRELLLGMSSACFFSAKLAILVCNGFLHLRRLYVNLCTAQNADPGTAPGGRGNLCLGPVFGHSFDSVQYEQPQWLPA